MQRYFVDENINNKFILSSDDSYHVFRVMRMKLGDKVEILCNQKLYICSISNLEPLVEVIVIKEVDECNEINISVSIVQSLVNEQKMDYILQKTTELGVMEIIPYMASRSIIKINNKEEKKIQRWQKIVKEAAEQSKRNIIPVVKDIISIDKLSKLDDYDVKILCTVNENTQNLKKVLSNLAGSVKMLFVIGPEGGFTKEEENKMIECGFLPVSLGNSVLRTETASTFIMSVVRYLDMR